ncbi:MAG: acetyl-CoA carboxylase biotin carboxyl carrier protein subunit [Dehalococcoidales bacterium]|nr:acetyl-CoA carboxylase biotin carboxyl carrier protein subunit [Dehalococcoidales bacterium]
MAQEIVEAPITGTIISIEVKVGDKVEEGDVLLYIESMKMENPIMAPVNGKVAEIKVTVKQVVETGKPLVVLDA